MNTDVLIIGGGLSGLHTAHELSREGVDFLLIEARDRLGGRILSCNAGGGACPECDESLDLGPAWFWPGQIRMETLIRELDLTEAVFSQYASGDSLYEDENRVHRGIPGLSMAGSYRMAGGMYQIVSAIEHRIDARRVRLNTRVKRLQMDARSLLIEINNGIADSIIEAGLVVFSMPPRLVASTIRFEPLLSETRRSELASIPTWMAGQAKLIAVYEEPFWRHQGLSGDVISLQGPLREIHDASANVGNPYALFGFFGVPAAERKGQQMALEKATIQQLVRLFGKSAERPSEIFFQDWAVESETATYVDQAIASNHSSLRLDGISEPEWHNRVIWSGSETANSPEHNAGFLEGALESSQSALALINSHFSQLRLDD